MFPHLPSWGPLTVRPYGIALVLAFAVGLWLSLRRAGKAGLPGALVVEVVEVCLVASIVGARGQYVATHWSDYAGQPLRALALWEGGLTFFGGAVPATLLGLAWIKGRGLPVLITADLLAPAVALGEAITRLGCFVNGCCFGSPTMLPWGILYPPGSFAQGVFGPVHVHPSQVYQALWAAAVTVFLLALGLRRRPGTVFWSLVFLLPLGRIFLDFFRYYDQTGLWKIGGVTVTHSQLTALVLSVAGAGGLLLTSGGWIRSAGPRERSRGRRAAKNQAQSPARRSRMP